MSVKDCWENKETAAYIGGGVYVVFDGYAYRLRKDSPHNAQSEIALVPGVIENLNKFRKKMANQ